MAVTDRLSKSLFDGTVANAATQYVGVPITRRSLGVQIRWLDATSAATITLEYTNMGPNEAPVETAGDASVWGDSGVTVTGPTATAESCSFLNLDNINQRRARLKIVATADCLFDIREGLADA